MEGVVKFFDEKNYYGFLRLLDGDTIVGEYFFSGNDVIGDRPGKGDRVNFLLDDPPSRACRRELIAVDVEKISNPDAVTLATDAFEKLFADEREGAHADAY